MRAFLGEGERVGAPMPLCRAGDEPDLIVEAPQGSSSTVPATRFGGRDRRSILGLVADGQLTTTSWLLTSDTPGVSQASSPAARLDRAEATLP